MPKEVAVHTGPQGNTVSIDHPGTVTVCRRIQGKWEPVRSQFFFLEKTKGLPYIRRSMEELIDFLGEAKVFVAAAIAGIPYYMLEKAGLTVWEFAGTPPGFLDQIANKEEELALAAPANKESPAGPRDLGGGRYTVNLTEIQQNNSGITSKQVLQSFFRKGRFVELDVFCHHIPPWLEAELLQGDYFVQRDNMGLGHKLTIRKRDFCGNY